MEKERILEDHIVEELVERGWEYVEQSKLNRTDSSEPLLIATLVRKIKEINGKKGITDDDIQKTVNELKLTLTGPEGAKKILQFYKYGIPLKFEVDGTVNFVSLFDNENLTNNEFIISRQVVYDGSSAIRVDIIL